MYLNFLKESICEVKINILQGIKNIHALFSTSSERVIYLNDYVNNKIIYVYINKFWQHLLL